MANKIFQDKFNSFQNAYNSFQEATQQSVDPALKAFTEDQKKRFEDISKYIRDYNRQLDALNTKIRYMAPKSDEYEETKEAINQLERNISGYERKRSSIAEQLKRLGEEDVIEAQKLQEAQDSIYEAVESARQRVRSTEKAISDIVSDIQSRGKDVTQEEREKLCDLQDQLMEEQADLESAEKRAAAEPALKEKEKGSDVKAILGDVAKSGSLPQLLGQAVGALASDEHESNAGELLGKVSSMLGNKSPLGAIAGKILNVVGKILDVAMATRKTFDSWVDEAAAVLANNVGRINAALEGTGQTYQSTMEGAIDALGLNRYVKQTEYISQIANLTSRGITYNLEQRALLETIKDKTIASFSSMDANLLRLVRLKQTDLTATQFGLEAALRNTLNKVFKDSTYLQDMFDGIQSAITDAVIVSGGKDVTAYSSVIQTWMGAMYESGVDSSMVTKIANALNNLGSGNVSALASDSDIQRLVLLSMDTIGMDYADILQQGLSTSDINDLLTAIVNYLVEIESNTKNNNVLTSSYTQLFGMSMADLQAFKNLSGKMGSLSYVNQSSAIDVVNNELKLLQSQQRTIVAEQIDNAFANARFTFGGDIAADGDKYLQWKVANFMLDTINSFTSSDAMKKHPLAKTLLNITALPFEASIFKEEVLGIMRLIKNIPSLINAEGYNLQSLINGAPTYGDSTSISATLSNPKSNFKTVNTMSSIRSGGTYQTDFAEYNSVDWDKTEEEDPILSKLKELDEIKVKNDAGNKAFAVFLTGMTNEALSSFASIFADENAMSDTFTGKNNVLTDNLFKYGEDKSSNSTKKTDTKSNNTAKAV